MTEKKKVSRRKFLKVAGAVGAVGAAGAIGYYISTLRPPPTPTPTRKVVYPDNIIIGTRAAIGPFDPIQPGFRWGSNLAYSCYDRLFYYEPETSRIQPRLVEDWSISDDRLTYNFKIRKGVKFHNGDEMDAEDVKYTLERARAIPRGTTGCFVAVAKDAEIRVKGSYELEMKLKEPRVGLIYALAHPGVSIINRRQLEAHGGWEPDKDHEWLARNEIGSGPYMLHEFREGERLVLKRYDNWWTGKANTTFVTWIRVIEASTQVAMMKAGEIDFVPLFDTSRVKDILGIEGVNVIRHEDHPKGFCLYFNTSGKFPETANKKVRHALAYAVPYQSIINAARAGWATRTTWFNVEGTAGYLPPEENPYVQDYEKAKQLLTEAGYPDGFTTTLWWSSATAAARMIAVLLKESFGEIGVTLELKGVTDPVLVAEIMKGVPMNLMASSMETADVGLTSYTYLHTSAIEAGQNYSHYSDPEMDKLLDQVLAESEFAKADELIKEIVRKNLEDLPIVPLYRRVEPLPFQDWIDPGPITWEYLFWYPVWRWKKGY